LVIINNSKKEGGIVEPSADVLPLSPQPI